MGTGASPGGEALGTLLQTKKDRDMYIHGTYYNEHDEAITVYIVTRGDRSLDVEIGGDDIMFSDDAVELTSQVNDTFDSLLKSQAFIRLLCRNYVEDFFCSSYKDAVVNIYRDGACLFAGYIEPQAYSQGYNEEYDEVELTCIDAISALEYSNYRDIGSPGVSYRAVKSGAKQVLWSDIVSGVLSGVTTGLDILGGVSVPVYYDGSKALSSSDADRYKILEELSISELLFLGDEEDDVWTNETVLVELLKYLNLHIVQEGLTLWLYSWETLRSGEETTWCELGGNGRRVTQPIVVDIETSKVADCDTKISVSETYNQLELKADVQEMENLVQSPLESEKVRSVYPGIQKYMTEYASDGEGKRAFGGFWDLIDRGVTSYTAASVTDWYVQVKNCMNWKFYGRDKANVLDLFCKQQKHQEGLPNYLGTVSGASALLSVGSVKKENGGQDNSLVSDVGMSTCMVVSVNGNGKDEESSYQPNDSTLLSGIPCAEYVSNQSGGVFSPSDDETTHYIVFSGKLVMNPLMKMTDSYKALRSVANRDTYWHMTVPSRKNSDGRYYTRRYWKAENWRDDVVADDVMDGGGNAGFLPFTGDGPQEYKYNYSGYGDDTDKLSKLGVLQCMLVIGDKCVVEKKPGETLGTGVAGTGNGQLSDYVWLKYKERSACSSDEEYYGQSFSIGFDPKVGDYIVGTEYSLQNNLNYTDNVAAEGTAIPIRMSDHVSGEVRFLILGPVNSVWNDITRRHPSFWRHTKWSSKSVPLLSHVSNIMIRDMEVKLYSDNGKMGSDGEANDLVYLSDTAETFVRKKDDLEMKITTALTSKERREMGVQVGISLSSPLNEQTGYSLLGHWNRSNGETAKAEQHYVNDYWEECHVPRVVLEQNLMDGEWVSRWNLYRNGALGKTFAVMGISRDLTAGTAMMTLKERF